MAGGKYLNPGVSRFGTIIRGKYVDKTGMLAHFLPALETDGKLFLVSRARRFGKSYAAAMLSAFLQTGYDTSSWFCDRAIAKVLPDWRAYCNQYNVLYIDMTDFQFSAREQQNKAGASLRWIPYLMEQITADIANACEENAIYNSLQDALHHLVQSTGKKVIWIVDEWDLLFRESSEDPHVQQDYLEILHSLFKAGPMDDVFAGAYMTGIMPMFKIKDQFAVSGFRNYTMLEPGPLAPFVGFTCDEVKTLCAECQVDFEQMKKWYDGYAYPSVGEVYNPHSVMKALQHGQFHAWWVETAHYAVLKDRIMQGIDGLEKRL